MSPPHRGGGRTSRMASFVPRFSRRPRRGGHENNDDEINFLPGKAFIYTYMKYTGTTRYIQPVPGGTCCLCFLFSTSKYQISMNVVCVTPGFVLAVHRDGRARCSLLSTSYVWLGLAWLVLPCLVSFCPALSWAWLGSPGARS